MKKHITYIIALVTLTVSCGTTPKTTPKTEQTTTKISLEKPVTQNQEPTPTVPRVNIPKAQISSPEQLNQALIPVLNEFEKAKQILKTVLDTLPAEKYVALLKQNNFNKILNTDHLTENYLIEVIDKNQDTFTYSNPSGCADQLLETQELLRKHGLTLWQKGSQEIEPQIQVDRKAQYAFFEKYLPESYKKLLFCDIEEQQDITWDAYVHISIDSLADRLKKWVLLLKKYGTTLEGPEVLYVKEKCRTYITLMLFCELDNSLTFDHATKAINPDCLAQIEKVKISHPTLSRAVTIFTDLLNKNKGCYSHDWEMECRDKIDLELKIN